MGRLLTILLIVCLAVSHGRASATLPLPDGSHQHLIGLTLIVDHDIADASAAPSSDDDAAAQESGGKAGKTVGHHVHSAGDGLAFGGYALPEIGHAEVRGLPVDDPVLRLSPPDPIAEPPSA